MELAFEWEGEEPHPGQFVNVKVDAGSDPLLRRPFSVYDYENGILRIVVKRVGRGTNRMALYAADEMVDILGPLGKGFSVPEDARVLLVGGGVGNAPLFFLARELREAGSRVTCVYGMRSAEYVYCAGEYRDACEEFIIATDDGSEGTKGTVADVMPGLLDRTQYDAICACGPLRMLEAVTGIAVERAVPIEVSLENYFGCGVGLCVGCTVETTSGNRRACVDGPVMDGSAIVWSSLEK